MTDNYSLENNAEHLEASVRPTTSGGGRRWRDYAYLLLVSGLVVLLDQWTKAIVRANLTYGEIWVPFERLAPFARIVHWNNRGAAFGIFQEFGLIFTLLAFLVAGAILYYFPQVPRRDWPLRLALGLQLGGAIGNLIDRLIAGVVTDFISVGNFPVFNIADASIFTGVAILALGMLWNERRTASGNGENQGQQPDVDRRPIEEPGENSPPQTSASSSARLVPPDFEDLRGD